MASSNVHDPLIAPFCQATASSSALMASSKACVMSRAFFPAADTLRAAFSARDNFAGAGFCVTKSCRSAFTSDKQGWKAVRLSRSKQISKGQRVFCSKVKKTSNPGGSVNREIYSSGAKKEVVYVPSKPPWLPHPLEGLSRSLQGKCKF